MLWSGVLNLPPDSELGGPEGAPDRRRVALLRVSVSVLLFPVQDLLPKRRRRQWRGPTQWNRARYDEWQPFLPSLAQSYSRVFGTRMFCSGFFTLVMCTEWLQKTALSEAQQESAIRRASVQVLVLSKNVGPPNSINVSEICLKYVRKLSVTKNCRKTVLNVSDICHKSISCKYLSEICRTSYRYVSNMCLKL